jgi:hypothetical protein
VGEYINASIKFGGKLPAEKAPELVELLNEKGLDPDWGHSGDVELEDLRTNDFFASNDVNYGNLDELRSFAEEHGLWYEYECEAGPDWDGETVVYDPTTGKTRDYVGNQQTAITLGTVKKLGSYKAVLAYFDKTIPHACFLNEKTEPFESVGIQEVARATIKTSPKIFNFFADQTYANKPRAICRELVANAVDSHVMAGKGDVPVEVWLPTMLDPTFKVRDQGLGMSHEFMMNEFMCYADGSTKDGSNVAIGGFGIGSKSPFAYVDQYTVRSVFDGVESVYSIFKDEEGIPSIGLLGQRTTTSRTASASSSPSSPTTSDVRGSGVRGAPLLRAAARYQERHRRQLQPAGICQPAAGAGACAKAGSLQVIMGGVMYPVNGNL